MKKYEWTLFSIFFLTITACHDKTSSIGAKSITVAELRDHVFYLASDSLLGRMTGTPEFNQAAYYTISQFQQAGLYPGYTTPSGNVSYIQPVLIDKCSYNESKTIIELSINGKEYSKIIGREFIMQIGRKLDNLTLKGDVAFVGYGIKEPIYGWNDYKDIDTKNKWVIFINSIPDSILNYFPDNIAQQYRFLPDREKKRINTALESGAIGTISILPKSNYSKWNLISSQWKETYLNDPWMYYECDNILIDTATIKLLFKDQLFDPLNLSGKYCTFNLINTNITFRKDLIISNTSTSNVLALIEGTDQELYNEIITIGAHLDHLGVVGDSIYNGADDNASGCAAILEIAEALIHSKPKRTILFLLYGGEEVGFLGSNYFVHHPTFPIENIKVNLNLDIMGRIDGDAKDLSVIGADRINSNLKDRIIAVNNRTEHLLLDFPISPMINSSDHYPFYLMGIPSVLFTTGEHKDYHTPADDPAKIDYDFFQKNCRLIYEIVLNMANGDSNIY